MGINRSRRDRTGMRDKFSLARIASAKCEAKTLEDLVDQDMDLQYLLYEGADNLQSWEETIEVTAVPDAVCFPLPFQCHEDRARPLEENRCKGLTVLAWQVLYEMGILYDTPVEENALPVEQDTDWDIVSEVSEWDLVSLDGGFSDDDSWG